jgi:SP family galactose:H+ symporter-like MFS transporter
MDATISAVLAPHRVSQPESSLQLYSFPALILGLGTIFIPFSPRWLMMRGREAETRSVLAGLGKLPQNEVIEVRSLLCHIDSFQF